MASYTHSSQATVSTSIHHRLLAGARTSGIARSPAAAGAWASGSSSTTVDKALMVTAPTDVEGAPNGRAPSARQGRRASSERSRIVSITRGSAATVLRQESGAE